MEHLWKAVLSSPPASPSDSGFVVMALYGQQKCLAFYKPGNNAWVALDINQTQDIAGLICSKGHFYAVDYRGRVVACDLNTRHSPNTIEFAAAPERKDYHSSKRYLVESIHGELWQVVGCNRLYDTHGEVGIEVFRHNGAEKNEEKGWVRVADLGEEILLLDFRAENPVSSAEPRPAGGTISLAFVHPTGEWEAACLRWWLPAQMGLLLSSHVHSE
ncbi:putative F-box protein At5g55150 [Aristolochia californica]|uniref:putative F-box protein At5g55150 n=1 Tax=Aristolochia californica TaxID=171875 RepID=UPI0035D9B14A